MGKGPTIKTGEVQWLERDASIKIIAGLVNRFLKV
jgi:hypothetical protein